jgi:hypothetical protein
MAAVKLGRQATFLAAALAVCMPAAALAATQGGIASIVLSSGGLAEVTRNAQVQGSDPLIVNVPLDQVDDVLKSMVVRDPSGGVAGISLDGLSPVEETFRRMPFSPEDMTSVAGLARSLQGTAVRATSGGRTIEGAVLGVSVAGEPPGAPAHNSASDDSAPPQPTPVLAVMTDSGAIQSLALGSDAVLDIQDASLRDKVRLAAEVSGRGRTDDVRGLRIVLGGSGERAVGLSYVVAAPVWKTAYRLMTGSDGKARLQAWAVFENATGEDWHDVKVTLSSGAPVTLSQQLLKRYWQARPEVPVLAQRTAPPRPDAGAMRAKNSRAALAAVARAAPAPMVEMASRGYAADMAEPSEPVQQAQAREGDTSATYVLPETVDLAAGQTYTAPYLDAQVSAQRVSLYQAGQASEHPVAALLLENDTEASLPPGILTVYDQHDGYVGDARLLGIPKGESRMASFAGDGKVTVRAEHAPQSSVSRMSVVDGVLKLSEEERLETVYTVKGAPDSARTVIIEHPRRDGWRFSSEALDASSADSHRLRVQVDAGATVEVKAQEAQTRNETYALVDAGGDDLLYWSGLAADKEMAASLRKLAGLRGDVADAQAALEKLQSERGTAEKNQSRIRENLRSVPQQSELAQRYLSMLGQEEDRIAGLQGQIDKAQAALDTLHENMAAYIRDMG